MNLILLSETDFTGHNRVYLTDRRAQHILSVHQPEVGDQLKIGLLNQKMGSGRVIRLDSQGVELEVEMNQPPPPPLPVTLILALPRPRMLARSLQHISTLGVKKLILLHTQRVEKSYWMSPELKPEKIREHLLLGLEQARDTLLPDVTLETRFRPFVEDKLPTLCQNTRGLIAHPGDYPECPRQLSQHCTLAIGPEGGFIPYEIEQMTAAGMQPVQMGPRILRVETAVTALLSRLF